MYIETLALEPQSLSPTPASADEVEALLEAAVGKQVVMLGESNHFIREKTDFRLWWLRELGRKRRLVVGEELSWTDGRLVDQYFRTGDQSLLDRTDTLGDAAPRRSDRDDLPTGILAGAAERFPKAGFRQTQTTFYDELRKLDCVDQYFGFDIGSAYTAYPWVAELAASLAAGSPDDTALVQVREALQPVPGESIMAETRRLEAALNSLTVYTDAQAITLQQTVRNLIDNLRYQHEAHPAASYEALRPAMARRENFMKDQVTLALGRLGPDQCLVLLGHMFHLARNDSPLSLAGVGPGGGLVSSLGHHLCQERQIPTFSAWMLYAQGRDSQPFPDLPCEASYPSTSINHQLAQSGKNLIVPGWALQKLGLAEVGHMYNQTLKLDLAQQVDAIWFTHRVSPLP